MSLELNAVLDPLFLRPFFTGLAFAVLLPLLGAYLRLRNEWLAALAFAQTAAAGALLALLLNAPLMLGGLAAAGLAVGFKHGLEGSERGHHGAAYALLLLVGWALSVLLVANLPLAERVGHALFDGQLYFTERSHLFAALACLVIGLIALHHLSAPLLRARFFPDFFRSRGVSLTRIRLGFDLLIAASLALATMSIGVMSAFALVFVPPWMAWRRATSWRTSLLLATALGTLAYGLAFGLALALDQPFGPLLALVLVSLGAMDALLYRRRSA